MSTIDKFPIPGVSQPGQAGDAAPDSLLAELRAKAAQKRRRSEITIGLPGRWEGTLRARYGMVGIDELESWQATLGLDGGDPTIAAGEAIKASLEIVHRACRAIEARGADSDEWVVLEDALGPVKFDDRLARLLSWERPGDEFVFSIKEVYDRMFDGNGIALGQHIGKIAEFMGLVEEEIAASEPSTGGGLTRSAPPSSSE